MYEATSDDSLSHLQQRKINGDFGRYFVGQNIEETSHFLEFFLLLLLVGASGHFAVIGAEARFLHLDPSLQRFHVSRRQLLQFLLALSVEFAGGRRRRRWHRLLTRRA